MELAGAGRPVQPALRPEDRRTRELKKIGRDDLAEYLIEQAEAQVQAVDLKEGEKYLEPDWGVRSVSTGSRLKFGIKLTAEDWPTRREAGTIKALQAQSARTVSPEGDRVPGAGGHGRFMGDKGQPGGAGPRYDREGLLRPGRGCASRLPERRSPRKTSARSPRAGCKKSLVDISRERYPATSQEEIDAKLDEEFEGTREVRSRGRRRDRRSGSSDTYGIEIPAEALDATRRRTKSGRRCGTPSTHAIGRRCAGWSAACCSTSSTRVEEPPLHDGPSAVAASAWSATPRSIPRRSTSAKA